MIILANSTDFTKSTDYTASSYSTGYDVCIDPTDSTDSTDYIG